MVAESTQPVVAPMPTQLTQVSVPITEAAEAFSRQDAEGRIPIVIAPMRLTRYLNSLVIAAGAVFAADLLLNSLIGIGFFAPIGIILAAVLLGFGVLQWFFVRVPEGASALLARRGRYERTIGSGMQILPPYLSVTHLVTRRELPFDVPIVEARTADDVRAQVDALVTFGITDPSKFVYQIATKDFDQVLQAACQEVMRSLVRSLPAERLSDLVGQDAEEHRARIEALVAPYGVSIHRIIVTYAHPPEAFLRSQEGRQLAVVRRSEQAEQQALAQRRQEDSEELTRQQIIAQAEQQREALEAQLRQIAARRHLVEEEAALEAERLSRLEERLRLYPQAARWERERARLDVARALAGNTRAILQIGNADDISRVLAMREDLLEHQEPNVGALVTNNSPHDAAPHENSADPQTPDRAQAPNPDSE